ncbi:MAG: HTTM domain-containing protein [Planctomycetaceae bacterium]|nr:HTTM domain-containing protein [Planctomycetaceae bacterium]
MYENKPPRWWRRVLLQVFGCDPRALAVFRVGLGLVILLDVGLRWPYLEAFLTDTGPVDRGTASRLLELDYGPVAQYVWSLNFLSGDLWWQQLLMVVLSLAAFGLIVGWRTWWMTCVCWVLVVSLHMRCPVILSSGDTLLRGLLFFSMFAPLGAWWSVDAWNFQQRSGATSDEPSSPQRVLTAGTAGLIVQLFCMYFFAGIAKWNVHWWEGDAMEYVFRLDLYARPWSSIFLQYPLLLKLITWATLFAEIVLIVGLLLPWRNTWWRVANVAVYYALHLSIAATMEIGLFPYISMVGWLPLFPAAFFNRFDRQSEYAAWLESSEIDRGTPTMTAQAMGRDWSGGLRLLGQSCAGIMVFYIVLWNTANIPVGYDGDLRQRLNLTKEQFVQYKSPRELFSLAMPAGLRWVGAVTGTGQHFQMFGVPPWHSPWFVYDGTLEDGVRMDLLRLEPVSYDRPASGLAAISGHHWRKLHDNMLGYGLADLQQRVAEYKLMQWNATHREGKQVVALKVTCFANQTGPQYQGEPPMIQTWYDWRKPLESIQDLEKLLQVNPDLLPGL